MCERPPFMKPRLITYSLGTTPKHGHILEPTIGADPFVLVFVHRCGGDCWLLLYCWLLWIYEPSGVSYWLRLIVISHGVIGFNFAALTPSMIPIAIAPRSPPEIAGGHSRRRCSLCCRPNSGLLVHQRPTTISQSL